MAKQALQGVKIADFGWAGTIPMTTLHLAQHGATVVRVESSLYPDNARASAPFKDNKPGLNRSGYFSYLNANKYSMALNMRNPRGLEVARKLVAWADVVCENFTPGVMKRWGLDYEGVRKIKPDIIMLSSCNLGQTGPHAQQPGWGIQLTALSGFVNFLGWPDRLPVQPYGAYTDVIGPKFGAAALVAALDYRRRTGKGQYLDLSQLECSLQFLSPMLLDYGVNQRDAMRSGNSCSYAAPHGAYPCSGSNGWVAIAVFSDDELQALCHVMGRPEIAQEPRFASLLNRKQNKEELDRIIAEWTTRHTAEEVMALLQEAGVSAGVVRNTRELVEEDPQLKTRHFFRQLDHPEMGKHRYQSPAYQLSKTPAEIKTAAPCLGEHTEYVLRSFLGMRDEEIVELLGAGALE